MVVTEEGAARRDLKQLQTLVEAERTQILRNLSSQIASNRERSKKRHHSLIMPRTTAGGNQAILRAPRFYSRSGTNML